MDQSPSPEPEEKAANADQTPDAQPVPDEVAASEQEEAEQSPSKSQPTKGTLAEKIAPLRHALVVSGVFVSSQTPPPRRSSAPPVCGQGRIHR